MALHRDIYWVGRQWAVTGYGIQACDQKQKGKFDIESGRLWEDGVLEDMRALKWLNTEDFDHAIAVARKYYPEPAGNAARHQANAVAPAENVAELKQTAEKVPNLKESGSNLTKNPAAEPKWPAQKFDMRVEGWPAKFVPLWRIRIKR